MGAFSGLYEDGGGDFLPCRKMRELSMKGDGGHFPGCRKMGWGYFLFSRRVGFGYFCIVGKWAFSGS